MKTIRRPSLVPRVEVRTKQDRRFAKVLRLVEGVLHELAAYPGAVRAQKALDAIQPWAMAYNPKADWANRASILELQMKLDEESRTTSAHLVGRFPHWAMYMIGESLAASMREPPNYMTCVMAVPHDGNRYEVTLRQVGKGKTAHELREEAEAKLAGMQVRLRGVCALVRQSKLDEALELGEAR